MGRLFVAVSRYRLAGSRCRIQKMPTFGVLTAWQRVSGGPEAECGKAAER